MSNQRFDLVSVTGKYQKDGVEKNRYHNVGTLFYNAEKNFYSARLESLPTTKSVFAFNSDKETEFVPGKILMNAVVVTGKYQKDGVDKNRYHRIGVLNINDQGKISLLLESLPFPGEDGTVSISFFAKEKKED